MDNITQTNINSTGRIVERAPDLRQRDGTGPGDQRVERREPPTTFVFGVRYDNIVEREALYILQQFAAHPDGPPARQVLFTNVHSIYLARKDRDLMRCINRADLVLGDGAGLKFAGSISDRPMLANLNGTDFTPKILKIAQAKKWTIFLLGTKPMVIDRCRQQLAAMFPSLEIAGSHDGFFNPEEEERIIDEINTKCPNLVLVALGSPRQEKWIARNAGRINAGACLGVGGLFDFLAGTYRRAPVWMRKAGLEWLFRFFQDPRAKWNRVAIEIPWFLFMVIAKRLIPPHVREKLVRREAFQ